MRKSTINDLLKLHLPTEDHGTLANFVLIAMRVVEEWSYDNADGGLSSVDKLERASQLVVQLVNAAEYERLITVEQAKSLRDQLESIGDGIKSLINTYIRISQHPAYLQLKTATQLCCIEKKKKKRKRSLRVD